jgi:hypothetical protein
MPKIKFENFKAEYISKNGADTETLSDKIKKIADLNLSEKDEELMIHSEIIPKVREEISFSYSKSGRTKYESRIYYFGDCYIDDRCTIAGEWKDLKDRVFRELVYMVFLQKKISKYPQFVGKEKSFFTSLDSFEKSNDQVMEFEKKLYIKIGKEIKILSNFIIEKMYILDGTLFLKIVDVDEKIQIKPFGYHDEYFMDTDCVLSDFIGSEILFFETKIFLERTTYKDIEFLYIQTSKGVIDFKIYKEEYYESGFDCDNIIYKFLKNT